MSVEKVKVRVASGEAVSGVLCRPESFSGGTGVVVAHGAGADMHTLLIKSLADGLCAAGFATLRFNFPYK